MYSTAITAISGDAAVDAQDAAAEKGNTAQIAMYNQMRDDVKPWMEAGVRSLGKMQEADYMRDFKVADYEADPGYAFRMEEGQKALERSASARGGLMSGGTLKALTKYGQGVASEEYGNAYNRFNADRDRRFGRLNTMSNSGLQASTSLFGPGSQVGSSLNANAVGVGNARAANHLRTGEAINKGMENGMSMMAMYCDRRLKTDIEAVSKSDLLEMKNHLTAYKFKYRNDKYGKGDYIGVMAQDLEKSKLGKTLVMEDHEGNKVIDVNRVLMLFLATMAEA